MEEVNTDQIVESDGGASRQLKQTQLQSMKVSLDRGGTATDTVQRVRPRRITNTVESGIGGLDIKLNKQIRGCQLRESNLLRTCITLEGRGTETSALQSISVQSEG